jgi:phage replication O-like protein O
MGQVYPFIAPDNCYTRVHNAVFDVLMPQLPPNSWKVLCAVIRNTLGYQREEWAASYSVLLSATGISSSATLSTAVQDLVKREMLMVTIGAKWDAAIYRLNPNYACEVGSTSEIEVGVASENEVGASKIEADTTSEIKAAPTSIFEDIKRKSKERKKESAPVASDDAPTPAPEIIEPAPIRKPRKAKAAAPAAPTAEPSEHRRLMTAYAEVLGYPFPNGGKEAAGARKLLDSGYTVEQVIAAYCEMKAQPFWASKHVSLHNVIQDIGAIVNRQEAKQRAAAVRANGSHQNGAYAHHIAPVDPGTMDAAEMRRQMAELMRAGGGK